MRSVIVLKRVVTDHGLILRPALGYDALSAPGLDRETGLEIPVQREKSQAQSVTQVGSNIDIFRRAAYIGCMKVKTSVILRREYSSEKRKNRRECENGSTK